MWRRVAIAAAALALFAPAAAAAQGVDRTCELALNKLDATENVAFPDDSAAYWIVSYHAIPGTRLRIQGRFPHARYMSYNVYDPAQRPLDALADFQLQPDPGASNPFVPGADRTVAQRSYTAFVEFGAIPDRRAPNTLYSGTGQGGLPNTDGTLIYRIYIPDAGRDEFGDAGLPTITLEASDGGPAPPSACQDLKRPSPQQVNEALAQSDGVDAGPASGRNPPRWARFTNLAQAIADNVTDNDGTDPIYQGQQGLDLAERGGNGGFLSNLHNAYVSAVISRGYGQVAVTRLRAPTFPQTRAGATRMPAGDQLRYWSMCQNDPLTQRFVQCLNDDRAVVGPDGFATFVVSTPAQRPANARADCGVNWLPWGPSARGLLIYRNMLPAPSFAQAIQRAKYLHEAATMGDNLPTTRYVAGKADYERLGCAPPAAAGTRLPTTCTSRRDFVIHLPSTTRRARVYVNGRRVRVTRRRARVDLRGLPRGRFEVKVVAVLRGGRTVAATRRYSTCSPRGRRPA